MSDLPDSLLRYRDQLERAVTADLGRRRRRTPARRRGAALGADRRRRERHPERRHRPPPPAVAPASAVERAAAALASDPRTILHVHMLGRQYDNTRPDIHWQNESWVGAGGYRMVETPPDGPVAETEQAKGYDRPVGRERVLEAPAQDAEISTSPEDKFRGEALQYLRKGKARVTGQVRREDGRRSRSSPPAAARRSSSTPTTTRRSSSARAGPAAGPSCASSLTSGCRSPTRRAGSLSISAQHGDAPVIRDAAAYQDAIARLFPHG